PVRIDVETGEVVAIVTCDADIDDTAVDPTGRRLAYARNHDGATEIVIRDLSSSTETTVQDLPPGALYEYWQSGLAADKRGERLAISWTGSRATPNVWLWSNGATTQLTNAGVESSGMVEPEHITYPTFDGRQIPALFYPPAQNTENPPCVVVVHGGPEGQSRP